MSFEALKENQGAVRMNISSEAAGDIFALDQPTGRPSILRQSQVENISRTAHRGPKVCFQTPRRDPVTKRIMSPGRTSRPASLEDNNMALDTHSASTNQITNLNNASTTPVDVPSNISAYPDDDIPVQSRGTYSLDLDNLDAINPFQSSNSMASSPPKCSALPEALMSEIIEADTPAVPFFAPEAEVLEVSETAFDETLPFAPSVENSLAECSSAEGTVIIKNIENSTTDTEEKVMTDPALQIPVEGGQLESQDSPMPPTCSYKVDFDNLDLVNPFQTGGSKIPNSPLPGKESAVSDPPLSSQEVKQDPEPSVQTSDVPTSSVSSIPLQENTSVTESSSSAGPPKENQVLLEFNFDDGAEVKRKPPPKRLGVKRPPGVKSVPKKTNASETEKKEPEPKQLSPKDQEEMEPVAVPAAKGSYTVEFDKFDDPNFNPFGTKAKMGNSPPHGVQTSPVLKAPVQQPEVTAQEDQSDNRFYLTVSERNENMSQIDHFATRKEDVESTTVSHSDMQQNTVLQGYDLMATAESRVDVRSQTCDLGLMPPSEDEFVPGALFMPGEDFDGQIDYLEQFGSTNFKDSALRKQSLYLKFDPLLKESPKKSGLDFGNSGFCLPRPSLAFRMMEAAKSEGKQKSQSDSMKLLDLPQPSVEAVVPDPTVLDLLVPTLKQQVNIEDSIIEVLKYSQRDMDAALQKAERQAEGRQQELMTEIEKMHLENKHMLFIVSEFEATITQITDEHKQKEDLAKIELERVLQEKDQLSKDLNELERSFSSVVKRLDRCKDVIEGFKKNEETLKQHALNCMDRLQKEEKRYQALKAHAEEKLDQANKAIAEVRTKQGAEVAALQVQHKREQLKVQSLEKDLEQKAKEVRDVTELCDELLHKVQKHGF